MCDHSVKHGRAYLKCKNEAVIFFKLHFKNGQVDYLKYCSRHIPDWTPSWFEEINKPPQGKESMMKIAVSYKVKRGYTISNVSSYKAGIELLEKCYSRRQQAKLTVDNQIMGLVYKRDGRWELSCSAIPDEPLTAARQGVEDDQQRSKRSAKA